MSVAKQFPTATAAERKALRPGRKLSQQNLDHSSPDRFARKVDWLNAGNLALQRSLRAGTTGPATSFPESLDRGGAPILFQRIKGSPKLSLNPPHAAAEQEADRVSDALRSSDGPSPQTRNLHRAHSTGTLDESSLATKLVQHSIKATAGSGAPLPAPTRNRMENGLGADLSRVRIHSDTQANALANSLGANAFTRGNDIYFNTNRYDPASGEGQRLLAHELTHVVQQGGQSSGQIQCDLMMSLPTALGGFEIEMATRAAPSSPGMEGHIRFLPDPTGPYSTQIGLIQVVNTSNVSGTPRDWSTVGTGAESGRQDLMTTGLGASPQGWFVDAQTATHARGSSVGPNYIEQWGISPPGSPRRNEFGWLRSPTDWHAASLYDYPWFSIDTNFDFETVAKATDTQTIYGSLEWGFQIRSGVVRSEYAHAASAASATFDEALERFRGYYTHEPIVLYFDTDVDTPIAGEDSKILGVLGYLSRYPDVRLQIDGYADERGTTAHNLDLSLRRALNVQSLCLTFGIDPSRIDTPLGLGETATFSAGSPTRAMGSLRANRRVVISFERTASTPITP
jgi:outer membrane protein OmpA-like peptidoglycan-associated protein